MKNFKIKYLDPKTEEYVTIHKSFETTGELTAEDNAEDYAYSIADKGPYTITEIK